jgi:hypothetical protein
VEREICDSADTCPADPPVDAPQSRELRLRGTLVHVVNHLEPLYPSAMKKITLLERAYASLRLLDGDTLPLSLIVRYGAAKAKAGHVEAAERCVAQAARLRASVAQSAGEAIAEEAMKLADGAESELAAMRSRKPKSAASKSKSASKAKGKATTRTKSTKAADGGGDGAVRGEGGRGDDAADDDGGSVQRALDSSRADAEGAAAAFADGDYVVALDLVRNVLSKERIDNPRVWDLMQLLVIKSGKPEASSGFRRFLVRCVLCFRVDGVLWVRWSGQSPVVVLCVVLAWCRLVHSSSCAITTCSCWSRHTATWQRATSPTPSRCTTTPTASSRSR